MRSGKSKKEGFTLVEIVISLMIFSIVAVVALGALVKIISVNKKAQTLQASITNLNFALETISREMRVGSKYHCASVLSGGSFTLNNAPGTPIVTQNCPANANLIAFESNKLDPATPSNPCPLVYAYFFDEVSTGNYSLKKAQQTNCGNDFDATSYDPVIDPNVSITNFFIGVNATDYPLVILHMTGYAGVNQREKERSYFELETAISSRVP